MRTPVMDDTARFDSRQRRRLAERLLAWFDSSARDLPWRSTSDLYAIWVSEIMLQQTQVATVITYYQRFMARFPTVASLAAADEHEVLRLWEGLGYYRRARQMHAAARRIAAEHASHFPETFDEVLALPGIGRYTAGAILSIGRDARLPILEANTIRVLSRLAGYRGDTSSTAGQRLLWSVAEQLLPERRSGQFNQALMELGALVCTPKLPECVRCPAQGVCAANQSGLQHSIPAPKRPKAFEDVAETAVVLRRRDGRVLLRLRPAGERWSGLWDFPRFALSLAATSNREQEVNTQLLRLTGQRAGEFTRLATIKHGVTRFRITLQVLQARIARVNSRSLPRDTKFLWLQPHELATRALSTTGRKIARMLSEMTNGENDQ
jgi:A/G-specific adenine glycosylase